MNTYTTKIITKRALSDNMSEVHIEKPDGFEFLSGQFIQIMIPQAEKLTPRSYSICSTPEDEHIVLCIKLLPDGVGSNYIRNIQEGTPIEIRGPAGHFICDADVPLLCVATGAGIAPIISIIRDHLEHKKSDKDIHLIFGVRHQEDIFWQDAFKALSKQYPHFKYSTTLSQPRDGWDGQSGRVTAHIPPIDSDTHAYLCGSPAMVQDVRKMLVDSGMEAEKIHFEIF